jgi:hypothetical protein
VKMAIARAMMIMAVRCLSDFRRDWALAMQAEFDVAAEAGNALSFAFGCLLGAWREVSTHEEGRFAIASYFLAIGVIVPLGGLLLSSVASGYAYLTPAEAGAGNIFGSGRPVFPVTYANQSGLSLLAILTFGLGLGHLYIAWVILDRNWMRVAVAGRIGAAVMATIVTFTGVLFLYDTCALPQVVAIAIELGAIWLLARWHADLTDDDSWQPRPHSR